MEKELSIYKAFWLVVWHKAQSVIAALPLSVGAATSVGAILVALCLFPAYPPLYEVIEPHIGFIEWCWKAFVVIAITYYVLIKVAKITTMSQHNDDFGSAQQSPGVAVLHNETIDSETKKRLSVHESGHLLSYALFDVKPIEINVWVTDKKGVNPRGGVSPKYSIQPENKSFLWDQMCCFLAGAVAEAVVYKRVEAGSESDMKVWESLARGYLSIWGFEDGYSWFENPSNDIEAGINLKTLNNLRSKQWVRVKKLLDDNFDLLNNTAELLVVNGKINSGHCFELIEAIK